ncbi:MAG: FlgD immunoglobulin-like domain containing protein, partial [Draconibacterium sp.]
NIGEIGLTEGYKIKVNWLDSINVCGQHVKYPYAIALQTGWNIIGYPQSRVYDAQEVVQQLIDRNTLVKVQDELGNSLENWGIFGGWQNHIGNLLPGEGYKVKVIAQDTLWIYESYTKSGAIQPELVASTHFRQNYAGNGVDHMNINLVGLPINVLQAGDEFAVFEGEACVGAVTLTQHNINNQAVQLTASAFDGQAAGGFTEGSRFTLKLWSLATGAEYTITPEIHSGSATFAKHETTVASLEKYTITGFDEIAGLEGTTVRCYPNPFSESVTIEINLSTEAEVEVEVLNQLGQVVSELIPNQRRAAGLHQLVWNGRNTQGQQVTPGMYHLRVSMNESVLHRKVIFSK